VAEGKNVCPEGSYLSERKKKREKKDCEKQMGWTDPFIIAMQRNKAAPKKEGVNLFQEGAKKVGGKANLGKLDRTNVKTNLAVKKKGKQTKGP